MDREGRISQAKRHTGQGMAYEAGLILSFCVCFFSSEEDSASHTLQATSKLSTTACHPTRHRHHYPCI